MYAYLRYVVHYTYWYVYRFRLIKLMQDTNANTKGPRPIPKSLWDCGWMLKYASQLGLDRQEHESTLTRNVSPQ